MKSVFIALTCSVLFSSCAKKEEEQQSNAVSANPSFTATIHDTSFTGNYFVNSYPGPYVQLYAYETSTNRSISLSLDNNSVGTHNMTTTSNGTSGSCQAGGGVGYYSNHSAGHGSITVTSSSATYISGSFSFTGYTLAGTDSASVTGTFTNMTF